jgi:hypothetical protein
LRRSEEVRVMSQIDRSTHPFSTPRKEVQKENVVEEWHAGEDIRRLQRDSESSLSPGFGGTKKVRGLKGTGWVLLP